MAMGLGAIGKNEFISFQGVYGLAEARIGFEQVVIDSMNDIHEGLGVCVEVFDEAVEGCSLVEGGV